MSRTKGKRYDTKPKLNIKKVFATIIAIAVFIMFIISLKNLLWTEEKPKEISTVTTYFTTYSNNKWGVIDNNGDVVIDFKHDEMLVIPNNTKDLFISYYNVNYDNGEYKTKVLNKNGREILSNYEQVEAIENYDSNSVWYESNILKYKKDGKYGLIDFSGKEVIPAEYDKIYAMPGIERSIIIEKDGLCGLVSNSLGEIIIEPGYAEIESLGKTYENGYIVRNTESYYGVITTDKKTALECKYDKIYNVYGNNLYAVVENGEEKIVNKSGEEVLKLNEYKVAEINGENIIIIKNDKYGVIDQTGNELIKPEYEKLSIAFDKNYIAKKEDKYGLIDSENNTLIDFKYTKMSYRKEANFIEADGEDFKTDIINTSLETVLTGVIISEVNTEKGYIRIRKDDEYKYYNFNFDEKPFQELMPTNTLFLVKENGKYGYENQKGERVVDCIYDDATEQNSFGYVAVKKDGVWGSLKSNGAVCLEPSVNLDDNIYINFIEKWHLYKDSNTNIYTK